MKVTSEGRGVNAGLGTEEYMQAFVTDKVQQQAGEMKQLATAANLMLHTQLSFKWTYLTCTTYGIGPSLLPLEMIIRTTTALTGRPPPSEMQRDLQRD